MGTQAGKSGPIVPGMGRLADSPAVLTRLRDAEPAQTVYFRL